MILKILYIKIENKLNLDVIDSLVIFKGLDYNNIGKIKNKWFYYCIKFFYSKVLKMFFDKNSINLDKFYIDKNNNFFLILYNK